MTDTTTVSPYQSFLNQTLEGDSRAWTWLVGIWFAMTIWFYGQMILSIPLTVAAMASEPGGLAAFQNSMPESEFGPNQIKALAAALAAPVLAFLCWLLRKDKAGNNRQPMLICAAAFAIISFIGLIYSAISSADPAQGEMLNTWLARSPWVYLSMLLMFPPLSLIHI